MSDRQAGGRRSQVDQFVFRTVLNWMQEDNEFSGAGDSAAAPPLMVTDSASGSAAASGR